jgi:hypothetical protein
LTLPWQGKERQLEGELQALITTKQLNLATHRETLLSQLVELCRQLDEADSVLHGGTKQVHFKTVVGVVKLPYICAVAVLAFMARPRA